ncbi:MAG: hypothetical protein PHP64_04475 [Actinomycetota bacterium]|nr:hypothetical protein [Actinomycetota bacterium]
MPFESLEPDILEFIDGYIDSFTTWDILSYFYEHPDILMSLEAILVEIERKQETVERALSNLAGKGIICIESEEGSEKFYRFSPSAEFRRKLDRFMSATHDRTIRLAVVSCVLQKEAKRI